MKPVTRFQADDGAVFTTAEAARERDAEHKQITEIMLPLGEKFSDPSNCNYSNGSGYVQHDVDACHSIARALVQQAIARSSVCQDWEKEGKLAESSMEAGSYLASHICGWLGRCFDGEWSPLSRALSRMSSIDGEGREWGQTYYRNNPDEAKSQECIWDRRAEVPK